VEKECDTSLSPVVYTDLSQRLSQLLWDLANEDTSYNGCEVFSPVWNQSRDIISYSKAGTVFSPMEGSPSDHILQANYNNGMALGKNNDRKQ